MSDIVTYCNYTIFTSILANLFPTSEKKNRRVRGTGPLVRFLAQVGGVDRFSQQVTPGDVLGSWSKKRRGKTWERLGENLGIHGRTPWGNYVKNFRISSANLSILVKITSQKLHCFK
jgi:hypothetical protein